MLAASVVRGGLADVRRPALCPFFPFTCGSCHPQQLRLPMGTRPENLESQLPELGHWPCVKMILGPHGPGQSCDQKGQTEAHGLHGLSLLLGRGREA